MLLGVLIGVAVLLMVSSCATAPTKPLASGELRLLRIDVQRGQPINQGISYTMDIVFEANGNPEINKACFYWSGDGPRCFNVTDVNFGPPGTFEVRLLGLNLGSYWVECYVEYIRGGETRKTNVVGTSISVGR
jgi:hypothetical protein